MKIFGIRIGVLLVFCAIVMGIYSLFETAYRVEAWSSVAGYTPIGERSVLPVIAASLFLFGWSLYRMFRSIYRHKHSSENTVSSQESVGDI